MNGRSALYVNRKNANFSRLLYKGIKLFFSKLKQNDRMSHEELLKIEGEI